MKRQELAYEVLDILTLLESEMISEEPVLSFSEFEIVLFYLKRISSIFLKNGDFDGEELTVQSDWTLSNEIYMKLMDLGHILPPESQELLRKEDPEL